MPGGIRVKILWLLSILALPLQSSAIAPTATPAEVVAHRWSASWIRCPNAPRREFGVYFFRKAFAVAEVPDHFVVKVSADNRYHLFVNGVRVLTGPATGDLDHWRFETLDIAGDLHAGRNVLAAVVWNLAEMAPMAQITNETGFILQGPPGAGVDTDSGWKVLPDRAFRMIPLDCNLFVTIYPCATTPSPGSSAAPHQPHQYRSYMAVGPGEGIDGSLYPWGWEKTDYDDSTWQQAVPIIYGAPREIVDTHSRWMLMPRNIPEMSESLERLVHVRLYHGPPAFHASDAFLQGQSPVTIPARSHVTLLLDQTYETTAYPELVTNGGRGSVVTLTYAEALLDEQRRKGNRDEIEGKHIEGFTDQFLPDGGTGRLFRPLSWRAYRYVQMDLTTSTEPLMVEDFRGEFTAYPFTLQARFETDDPTLEKIWQVGWRTVRLCSHETYMDCPYYERLQYAEDTRIEALISLYMTGDDRLVKNAIECFNESRTPEGLTLARYPAYLPQYILPFSLYWIDMMHDLWWYHGDADFLRSYLLSMRGVLTWFQSRLNSSGLLLGSLPWSGDNQSILLTLEFVEALQNAADLEAALGSDHEARQDRTLAARIANSVYRSCWDPARHLLADSPTHQQFSRDVNAFGVLTDAIPPADQPRAMKAAISDPNLAGRSLEFEFHIFRAMKKAGLGDEYLAQLQPWRDALNLRLTTFPEYPEPTRSDCHGWSAHPDFDLLATVAGIEPAAPAFHTVAIHPHLGPLKWLKASLPHPQGNITVEYRQQASGLVAEVILPAGVTGWFYWKGNVRWLHSGAQSLTF